MAAPFSYKPIEETPAAFWLKRLLNSKEFEECEEYHAWYWGATEAEAEDLAVGAAAAEGVVAADKAAVEEAAAGDAAAAGEVAAAGSEAKRRAQTKRRMKRRRAGVKRAEKPKPVAAAVAKRESEEEQRRAVLLNDFIQENPEFPGLSGTRANPERVLSFGFVQGQACWVIPLVWPGPA